MFANIPLKICLSLLVIALFGCYGARYMVFSTMENRIPQLLQELEQQHIHASVQSIETSWYHNRVLLKGITFTNQEPHSLPLSITEGTISSITITGIELFPLFVRNKISLDSLLIGKMKVTKYKSAKAFKKSKKERSFALGYVKIDSLDIAELDSLDKPISKTKFSFESTNIVGSLPLTDLYTRDLSITGLSINLPNSKYTITLDRIHLEKMNHCTVDSLRIIPFYSKKEFSQRADYETDRIECIFPFIEADGINHESLFSNQLAIHKISLSFIMSAYRDKRIKDVHKFKPLPDSLLRKLPFDIIIDSVRIRDSQLTYEEFGDEADSSGSIYFKKLNASVYHIANRDPLKSFELSAHAQFMNDGEIDIHGIFSNSAKSHFLEGSLKNFKLARINQMLKPSTGVSIESGKLDLMKFAFWYNNHQSDGELLLNYHDLKFLSLRENRKDKAVPNVAKTLLINAFIENDMDKRDSRAKRTGIIHYERNKEKFIFNFWWKSLLSGLKSASGISSKPEASS